MNILHHKSWHVRNRRNIERVRQDERDAAEQEAEKERRALFAERESRISLLRKRAQHTNSDDTFDVTNIFESAVSEDKGELRPNVEHEKEKKKEREDWEKKVGILTYLGQSELGNCDKPWYLKSHESRMQLSSDNKNATNAVCDSEMKAFNDPLNDMKRYLEIMKANKEDNKRKQSESKHNHREKHKRHSKNRRKDVECSSDKNEPKEMSKIEKLRMERKIREEREREKQNRLVRQSRASVTPSVYTPDERQRNYHTQFNPHLAKQNH
ncbi:hypothetical protein B4U80_06258 [Leptotrombidium deliense]|uniref:CBF1-interacting co-repressor CIR N-terminal domain-containing protein n=1 Tax=Leptotrombidium deliense TaxID=299467 RepID=A0A443RZD4_9ACAR|nr:hypothetical protein B4U80_06258 [Leptotrombidium deliense]